MVGEAPRRHQLRPEPPQGGEELLRPPDPREGQRPEPLPVHAGAERLQRPAEQRHPRPGQPSRRRARASGGPTASARSTRASPVGHRLAQRPGRDHPAVAEAGLGVHHQERQVLRQRRVLQPVVHHHRRRPVRDGGPAGGGPVARHPDRREGGEQQRLVAHLGGPVPPLLDPHRPRQAAAVAARDHLHRHAARLQPLDQRDDRGRLAGAAGGQVADADHRHPQPHAGGRHPPPGRRGPEPAERRQQPRPETRPRRRVPPEPRGAHQRLPSSRSPIAASTASVTSAPSLQAAQAAAAMAAARSGAIVATSASASSASERTSTAASASDSRR